MSVTEIGEQISVLAVFSGGKISPTILKWNGKAIRARQVTGRWKERRGEDVIFYISFIGEDDVYYEISFSTKTLIWRLERLETV